MQFKICNEILLFKSSNFCRNFFYTPYLVILEDMTYKSILICSQSNHTNGNVAFRNSIHISSLVHIYTKKSNNFKVKDK